MIQAAWAAFAFCIFYSLQITLQSQLVRVSIEPLQLIFLVNALAFVLMSIGFFLTDRSLFVLRAPRPVIVRYVIATLLWIIADVSSVLGLMVSSSLNLSILSRLQLFITYVGAMFFLGEALTVRKSVALAVATIGSVLTVYRGEPFVFLSGDLLFILFTFSISISGLFRQYVSKYIDARSMTYYMFGMSAVLTGIYVVFVQPLVHVPFSGTIFLIVVCMVCGFLAVNYSIAKGGATQFSLVSSLLPFITALFAYIVLREVPSVYQIVGGAVIIIGIVLFITGNLKYLHLKLK